MLELFKDDHIKIGRRYIRALSPLWWAIQIGKALAVGLVMYLLYIGLWIVAG